MLTVRRLWSRLIGTSNKKNDVICVNQELFMQNIIRECARADRSNNTLSLISLSIVGAEKKPQVTRLAVRKAAERLRLTDLIGWLDKDSLGILLPETNEKGAKHVLLDIYSDNQSKSIIQSHEIYTYPSPGWPFNNK